MSQIDHFVGPISVLCLYLIIYSHHYVTFFTLSSPLSYIIPASMILAMTPAIVVSNAPGSVKRVFVTFAVIK